MPTDEPETTKVLVAIAEIKGFLQSALQQIEALHRVDADHETRLREIEKLPIPDAVTQQRLKDLEDRHTISPGQLWAGLIGVAGLLASIATAAALLHL